MLSSIKINVEGGKVGEERKPHNFFQCSKSRKYNLDLKVAKKAFFVLGMLA